MIESIFVYGLMILCFTTLGTIAGRKQVYYSQSKFWTWETSTILIVFTLICGLRNNVGVDYSGYLDSYLHSDLQEFSTTEWLYSQLVKTMSSVGFHYVVYFGLIAFLQLFFILYAFKDYKYLYSALLFVFMTNSSFFMYMNGMRQCIALSVFLYASKFIRERSFIQYFAIIVVLTLIHKSAILLLPLYLIFFTKDLFKSKIVQLILLLIAIILSETTFWNGAMEWISSLADLIGYNEENRSIEERFQLYEDVRYSKGLRFYVTLIIGVICILFGDKVKEKFNATFWYNLFFLGLMSFILFYNAPLLTRATAYFIFSQFVFIAYTLTYLKNKYNNIIYKFMIISLITYILAEIRSNWFTQYYFIWQEPAQLSVI